MTRRGLLLRVVGSGLLALVAYLLFWPVPFDPASWSPLDAPAFDEGLYKRNTALAVATVIALDGIGPEDVAVDGHGRIYGGLIDGRIMRVEDANATPELFVDTGGRPLGLDFDEHENLIVADAIRGLLSVDPRGQVTVLTTEHGGKPFVFTDDVDVGPDGRYYFSDASSKWDKDHLREEFFEHRAYGRLLVYDPSTKQTTLLQDKLFFANGVAVSDDGSFVLVNETTEFRVRRLWLTGTRAGTLETFIDNLPGHPDGISAGPNGTFWLGIHSPRIAAFDFMLPKPWLRKIVYRLPLFIQPKPVQYSFVIGLDSQAKVIANLQDSGDASFAPITSAQVAGPWLYLGSLNYPGAARIRLPVTEH